MTTEGDKTPRADIKIQCCDCSEWFVWSAREQAFYQEKQFLRPKRCKACRALAKEARMTREAQRNTSS